ncbi:MAG TPA: FecR domain-containing protein [Caulobacteraceae bacterium]|nr:FecR domain-containing protein [Caulobacteraceae bacterium]
MGEQAAIVNETAADWIARRDSGVWSPADQAALDRWLAASTHNRVAWLRLNAAWEQAGAVGSTAAPPAAKAPWRRRAYAGAALAATLLAGVFAAVELSPRSYATTVGGSRAEMLDDGTRLELNTDSRVAVRHTDDLRRVKLDRGEAFFTVAREDRPFVVEAGAFSIDAGDAAFSVYRQGERVLVAVERGQVAVRRRDVPAGSAAPVICNAGSLVEAGPSATQLLTAPTRMERLLSWRRGLVSFDDARLGDVAAEFNRYNRTKLVITDPALAEARVGGAFRPTNLDAFLRILAQDLDVAATREDDRILLAAQK